MPRIKIMVHFTGEQVNLLDRAARFHHIEIEQLIKHAVKEHLEAQDYAWPPDEQG